MTSTQELQDEIADLNRTIADLNDGIEFKAEKIKALKQSLREVLALFSGHPWPETAKHIRERAENALK